MPVVIPDKFQSSGYLRIAESPPQEALVSSLIENIRHSVAMEWYLDFFESGYEDHERPHDLAGQFSKLDWDVWRFLAFEYLDLPDETKKKIIKIGVLNHRTQYHHRGWGGNDASEDALLVGAADTTRARREGRYNGKPMTFEEMPDFFRDPQEGFSERQQEYLFKALAKMRSMPEPEVSRIQNLADLTRLHKLNIGINANTAQQIEYLVGHAVKSLREKHGYDLTYPIPF